VYNGDYRRSVDAPLASSSTTPQQVYNGDYYCSVDAPLASSSTTPQQVYHGDYYCSVDAPLASSSTTPQQVYNGDYSHNVDAPLVLSATISSDLSPRCQSPSSSDSDVTANGHSLKLLVKSPFAAKTGKTKYSPIHFYDD